MTTSTGCWVVMLCVVVTSVVTLYEISLVTFSLVVIFSSWKTVSVTVTFSSTVRFS